MNSLSSNFGKRPDQPQQYFSSLDGLRGLIAIGVTIAHVHLEWFPGMPIMMDIFFVVSGFLITLVLLRNIQHTGNVQLLRFWGRRVRRLYPVLLIVVSVYLLIATLFLDNLGDHFREALGTLSYVSNWTQINKNFPTYFGHTWSLSIEEQFYLLWPLLLGLTVKLKLRRWGVIGLFLFLLVVSFLWRNWLISKGASWSRLYFALDTRMDAFLMGGMLALAWDIWHEKWYRLPYFMIITHGCTILLFITIICWNPDVPYYFIWQQSVVLILSCATILGLIAPSGSYLKNFFGSTPLRSLGLMCYSIYLWHWPLLWLLNSQNNFNISPYFLLVLVLTTVLSLSYLTYRYVELPILSKRINYE